ncbi:MAG: glycosyltransferase family 2 protein [Pseudomonadota bacterium]
MPASITAIVPTFNRSGYVVEALRALLEQTRPLAQIVVWNDGSTDGTEAALAALEAEGHPALEIHHQANGGKSQALNRALAVAKGDYVWICDDDDIALPDAAEHLGRLLEESDAGLSAARHDRFSENVGGERQMLGTGYWPNLSSGSVARHTLEDIYFFQNASFVKQEAFKAVGPFREDLARSIDYEMFTRLVTRFSVAMSEKVVFHQRKHDGARGPAAARHDAARSEAVWAEADRTIFAAFRAVLPISFYEAMFEGGDAALRTRAALLQRACVYARKLDWSPALEDLEAAANVAPDRPLDPLEYDILSRTMAAKHGTGDAFSGATKAQIMALSANGQAGLAMRAGLGRGAIWRVREAMQARSFPQVTRAAAFALGSRFWSRPVGSDSLRERDVLPKAAYQWEAS